MALDQQALEAAMREADRWDTGMVSRSGQPSRYFVARRDDQDDHIQVSEHTQHFEARDEMERQMMGASITAYLAALGDGWQTIETALKKVDETVLLRIEHVNYAIAPDEEKHRWEEVVTAYWTDFNSGGWVWHGLAGAPTHWRPLPTPPGEKK